MSASESQRLKEHYEFGPFRVDAEKEILLRGGEPVPLAPKTFQILLVLIRHNKEVVTKDDLMKTVWPDTFVEEANLSRNIFMLRKALGESPQDHQYILTVPGRGYRLAENVRLVPEQEVSIVAAQHSRVQVQVNETKPWGWIAAATILLLAIAGVVNWLLLHRKPILTEKDTLVLADFTNSTGDPVFDDTLRQGLAVELEQSPFLSLVSDARIRQTLRLMGQPADARLTPSTAEEICIRTGSPVVLDGSIGNLGNQYILAVRATGCRSGDVVDQEQVQATRKEDVLNSLDRIASRLRRRLGESLSTLEKFDTPLEQATTPSLEALEAYTMGRKTMLGDNYAGAIPFFQRAIQLDPNFAMAYATLGTTYWNLTENTLGAEYTRKAYELDGQVSGLEKLLIESGYAQKVTGNLEKARQIQELEAQEYPRYAGTHTSQCVRYWQLGQYEKALAEIQEAIRLDPSWAVNYHNLVLTYIDLNRFGEARATANMALAKQFDSAFLRMAIYRLAFFEGDTAGMAEQVRWAAGKPGTEGLMLEFDAQTAAYFGRMNQSRDISRHAVDSATRFKQNETVAEFYANEDCWEALFGNKLRARSTAKSALSLSTGREMEYVAALGLALAGDVERAKTLVQDLARRFPEDTMVQFNFLPTIRAQLALESGDASQAIELLQPVTPYELGNHWWSLMGPVYVRGEAYLAAHRGTDAAAEFQKILDHRGIVASHPFGALAHLQLARAYATVGDRAKAKAAYQDFLTLWKDADPDVPVLKQAKGEYAEL